MSNIADIAAEGRLIRGVWSKVDGRGRELLCLYTALAGGAEARPWECPAELCPRWLAHLIPWIDDAGSEAAWPRMVERFVAVAPKLGALAPAVEWRVRALILREAMRHAKDVDALDWCERAARWCEMRGRGEAAPKTTELARHVMEVLEEMDRRYDATLDPSTATGAESSAAMAAVTAVTCALNVLQESDPDGIAVAELVAELAILVEEGVDFDSHTLVDRLTDAILTELEAA